MKNLSSRSESPRLSSFISTYCFCVSNPDELVNAWTETTKELVAKLELKPGQKVLDVGCGVGGGDFYMAENFDVEVVGVDLSINMISHAIERAIGLKYTVEFDCADCSKKTYPEKTFDVIYTRDSMLYIKVRNYPLYP